VIKGRKLSEHFNPSQVKVMHTRQPSNMVLEYINHKKMRNNSFAEGYLPKDLSKEKQKKKKSSLVEESLTLSKCSRSQISQNSSSRDESLKKRLDEALSKTQEALVYYDRIKRRKSWFYWKFDNLKIKMSYEYNSSKILEGQDANNQSMNSQQL